MGDSASPWAGASLAWPAVNLAVVRAERAGDAEGARRARFGVLVLAALASEARRAQREAKEAGSKEASAPVEGAEERVSALDVDAEAAVVAWACDGFATAPGGSDDGDDDLRGASARLARSDPPSGRDPRSAACARPACGSRVQPAVQPPRRTREERRRTRRGRKGTEATRAGAKPSCTRRARSRRSRETSSPRKPFVELAHFAPIAPGRYEPPRR